MFTTIKVYDLLSISVYTYVCIRVRTYVCMYVIIFFSFFYLHTYVRMYVVLSRWYCMKNFERIKKEVYKSVYVYRLCMYKCVFVVIFFFFFFFYMYTRRYVGLSGRYCLKNFEKKKKKEEKRRQLTNLYMYNYCFFIFTYIHTYVGLAVWNVLRNFEKKKNRKKARKVFLNLFHLGVYVCTECMCNHFFHIRVHTYVRRFGYVIWYKKIWKKKKKRNIVHEK